MSSPYRYNSNIQSSPPAKMPRSKSPLQWEGVDMSLPIKRPRPDTLTPRGPQLDLFVRKVGEGGAIQWDLRTSETFDEFAFFDMTEADARVSEAMASKPDLTPLTENTVAVIIDNGGQSTKPGGSGVLLSATIVLTSQHIIDQLHSGRVLVGRSPDDPNMVQAQPVRIPAEVASLSGPFGRECMNPAIGFCDDGARDFCFLRLDEPMELRREPLVIQPELAWKQGDTICSSAFPAKVRVSPQSVQLLPEMVAHVLASVDIRREQKIFGVILGEHFADLLPHVITFGTIDTQPDLKHGSYVYCSNSVAAGMSGGPVVTMDNPSVLIGILSRSPNSLRGSVFLSVHDPSVVEMYNRLVVH